MYLILLIGLWCGVLQNGAAEYAGMRKPPNPQSNFYGEYARKWAMQPELDNSELLTRILALNARMKLMEQLQQMQQNQQFMQQQESAQESYVIDDNQRAEEITDVADFPETVDVVSKENAFNKLQQPPQFAYGPKDPRYWIQEPFRPRQMVKIQQQPEMQEYETVDDEIPSTKIMKETVPTFNVKGPIIPNPKLQSTKQQGTPDNKTNQKETETVAVLDQNKGSVVQKPLNLDDGFGIYLVAMIAGVSAAITVAVIAVGLGWYTLRQKIKAAADLDYPAYGVTGPNKDLLYPSSEKKFAQSVDMYNHQQQKQKKLSLENKSNGETNDGFSDLDGEFDMDDGDYTVYECPGFAPTGEMEVKNPLFADEPITVAQKHQPASDNTEDLASFETVEEKRSPNNNKHGKKLSPKNISPNKDKASKKK